MKWIDVQNNQSFDLESIVYLRKDDFSNTVSELLQTGSRMIALTPIDKNIPQKIIAVLSDSASSTIHIVGGNFSDGKFEFESWANKYPQTNYFECELSENYGYLSVNHPWLRPVRKQSVILGNKPYQFFKLEGEEVHEVAVGPIHAGVIEPGHFRFQCHGELIYNLEINLGYQHRAVENLFLKAKPNQRIFLAESIAGDTTIGHTFAHCSALESLTQTQISLRADVIRTVAAEIERIAMHLSGLGGLTNDIGFALPSASYGRLRTLAINSLAAICGSRYGRGLFAYGGINFDFTNETIEMVTENLKTIQNDVQKINEYLFSSVGALSRFEETGIINNELANSIGLVGLAARSSGIEDDIRINFPYSAYRYNPVSMITLSTGDVFARARARAMEMDEALRFVFEQIENLPQGKIKSEMGNLNVNSGVISIVEGWRGEIVHIASIDNSGNLMQYKIKDPSFNNWYGLSLTLRNTAISDFPLCNKSFDLSYSGHDL
ncbi:MAG: hydrogenase [Ignavibacteriales bacterium CG18_big_fil_WC_8_21_14_2_50_31_20]|nr:MAG: hydrogenase [Ignavibacteriales bacterium CG18_big_fil_WC_8_21_14_2_50_31_20]